MRIVFIGPPGAGKGTQAERMIEKYKLAHLSTGDMLRAARDAQTDVGKKADEFMSSGQLVPDEIIVEIIKHRSDDYDSEEYLEDQFTDGDFGAIRFFVNLVVWAILAFLGSVFYWTYRFFVDGIISPWILGWLVIVGATVWILIENEVIPAKEWRRNYKARRRQGKNMYVSEESTPVHKVAGAWIKGIYKKYCPKITWID